MVLLGIQILAYQLGVEAFTPVVPALGRPGRNREFKANLGSTSRFNIKSNSDLL